MPFYITTNNTCANCTDVVFQFKKFMTTPDTNGGFLSNLTWTVVASSDGTTANTAGDSITKYGSGTGGLGNDKAWFVLRAPGGNPSDGYKEFSFQRVAGAGRNANHIDNLYRIKYTMKGFDLSTGTATQAPSAQSTLQSNGFADERVILGSGTDAVPVGDYFANSSYTLQPLFAHYCAQLDGYGFYALSNNGSSPAGFFAFDPMQSGTYPAPVNGAGGDIDPYVTMVDNTPAVLSATSIYTPNSITTCYLRKRATGEGNVSVQGFYPVLYDNVQLIGNLPSNPYNQKDDTFPLLYARKGSDSPPNGYKGQSSLLRWHGQNRSSFSIVSIDTAGDRLVVGNVSIPWNNTPVSS